MASRDVMTRGSLGPSDLSRLQGVNTSYGDNEPGDKDSSRT